MCVDTENLAETFIGKLLSEEPDLEHNQTNWKFFNNV
jgi:putative IMPACT (imprinted ancient) family translation regulator